MESFFSNPVLFGESTLNDFHFFSGNIPDFIMILFTKSGGFFFYIFIFSFIYWFFNRRAAIRIMIIFYISFLFNFILKEIFSTPRPDPDKLIPEVKEHNLKMKPSSPGFPSGHTQGAVSFYTPIVLFFKNKIVRTIAISLIILIPYSRIYLGVHFLGDIIGGYIAGFIIVFIMIKVLKKIEQFYFKLNKKKQSILIIIPVCILFATGFAADIKFAWNIVGITSGLIVGAHLYMNHGSVKPKGSILNILLGSIIGFAGISLTLLSGKILHPVGVIRFMIFLTSGLWITYFAPLLFEKTGIYKNNK